MNAAKILLEAYLEAKDQNRPERILDCFASDAVVTYSIATDSISFPERVSGANAIAQILVCDLRARFTQCKTYYVCDTVRAANGRIDKLPWLVVMREGTTSTIRVGEGYYDWDFDTHEPMTRVREMHIHIDRMDAIEEKGEAILDALQSSLPYPWLTPGALRAVFDRLIGRSPAFAFLRNFKTTAA